MTRVTIEGVSNVDGESKVSVSVEDREHVSCALASAMNGFCRAGGYAQPMAFLARAMFEGYENPSCEGQYLTIATRLRDAALRERQNDIDEAPALEVLIECLNAAVAKIESLP